ncbi:DUF2934 domain-containing protein [Hoeflea ulvae]|uniref:DUF2934 domain-containing protein n=1 Tax=Hoeflea ulvae TaxID=2983764 RepID=A0ABT3YLZ4_9HYPH|nr:DUF2934 domain-containing protein [Hoeflea ulvae]MCY0096923.1 DUF2934 domain-containing protein [Hoeflea ulvae]
MDRETTIRERAHQLWEAEGFPQGKHAEHWAQAEREYDMEQGEAGPEQSPDLAARREAIRQHGDVYVVPSDLEDADIREAAPGVREQP